MTLTRQMPLFPQAQNTCHLFSDSGVTKFLTISAIWMAIWYGIWLWLQHTYGDYHLYSLTSIIIGFAPLMLQSIRDYRKGLLLSIVATPLLIAPTIPHGFTQGFGDLFAICCVFGFLLRHHRLHDWSSLWRRGYLWLVLILIAASLSLVRVMFLGEHSLLKYGIAEILGLCLNFLYLAVLTHSIHTTNDLKRIAVALFAACAIVMVFSLGGTIMSAICAGGYWAGHTLLTSNQSIVSTFGNPNYHAAYILTFIPLFLFLYVQQWNSRLTRLLLFLSIPLLLFFIQASLSRAAIAVFIPLLLGWSSITRFRSATGSLTLLLIAMLPLTYAIWWYPPCTCPDAGIAFCPYQTADKELRTLPDGFSSNHFYKDIDLLRTPKNGGGWDDKVRSNLAKKAISIWMEHPFAGVGIGLMAKATESKERAHNVILTVAAEQGIPGIIAWLGWSFFLIKSLWRCRPAHIDIKNPFFYIVLAGMATLFMSLFMDSQRMLWIWQLGALMVAWPTITHTSNNKSKIPQPMAPQ